MILAEETGGLPAPITDYQVDLIREVLIDGKPEAVTVRFPKELVGFGSKAGNDLIDSDFAAAIRSFRQARRQGRGPAWWRRCPGSASRTGNCLPGSRAR